MDRRQDCDPQGADLGGGSANPEFVERLAGQDQGNASPLSRRGTLLLAHYVKPPHVPEHLLDIFVESVLSTRVGDNYYPGNSRPVAGLAGLCARRPGRAEHHGAHPFPDDQPGRGPAQAAGAVAAWRGRRDGVGHLAVDLAYLGSLGAVPGWPGEQAWPPQPS